MIDWLTISGDGCRCGFVHVRPTPIAAAALELVGK